jgi:hypothetical protein
MKNGTARLLSVVLMGVLLGVTAVAYGNYSGGPKPAFTVLSQALAATGATVRSAEINGWVLLDSVPADEAILEDLVRTSFNKLGYDGKQVVIEKQQNKYFLQARGEIRADDLELVVISQVIYPQANKTAEAYTVINAVRGHEFANNEAWEEKISKILIELGRQPRINTCLVGWLDGKLNKNTLKHRLVLAFDSIQAVAEDQMFDDDFASITGYTPKLANFFKVQQEKVNVNMAMRFSPSEERTYVIIGSPVITREY